MFWAEIWKISEFLSENFQLLMSSHNLCFEQKYEKLQIFLSVNVRFCCKIFNIFELECFRNELQWILFSDGPYCNRTIDHFGGCWPDTLPGRRAKIECPDIIPYFNAKGNRICLFHNQCVECKDIYANSEGLDQPAYPRSLIRAFSIIIFFVIIWRHCHSMDNVLSQKYMTTRYINLVTGA